QRKEEPAAFDVILLTGRIRPFDRNRLLGDWLPQMEANHERPDRERPLFVVATQTIEVGANLNFDALVTEIAPLDALRQRFGRLDRLGLRKRSQAVILARKDAVGVNAEDPIYGTALAETWRWLLTQQTGKGQNKVVDFGFDGLQPPTDPEQLDTLRS